MKSATANDRVSEIDVEKFVADNDTGARNPGPVMKRFLLLVALAWSLFQLWIASPLPFSTGSEVVNSTSFFKASAWVTENGNHLPLGRYGRSSFTPFIGPYPLAIVTGVQL